MTRDEDPVDEDLLANWWTVVTRAAAQDPATWLLCARRLDLSAQSLWERFHAGASSKWQRDWETLPAALMLAGFALENLAKGLIIRGEPGRAREKSLAPWSHKGTGHELRDLLRAAGVEIAAPEELAIWRLEYFAVWAGRYPVPKDFEENAPIDSLGHRPPEISDDKRAAEWAIYRSVFARALALY